MPVLSLHEQSDFLRAIATQIKQSVSGGDGYSAIWQRVRKVRLYVVRERDREQSCQDILYPALSPVRRHRGVIVHFHW